MAYVINRKSIAVALLWVAAVSAQAAVRAEDSADNLRAVQRQHVLAELEQNVERLYRERNYVVVPDRDESLAAAVARFAGDFADLFGNGKDGAGRTAGSQGL